MLAELPNADYNSILVVNALNGMLPLALRDHFPNARIVCGEVFPFFKEHLTNLGFEVVDWDDLGDMKFDLVIGNPPYMKRAWKKFVEKMIDLSTDVVVTVNPDPTQNNTDFGEEVRTLFISAGVQQVVDCTKHFPNVSSGNISYFVCSKKTPAAVTFETSSIISSIVKKVCSKNPGFVVRGSQKSLTVETAPEKSITKPVPGLFSVTNNGIDIKYVSQEHKVKSRKHGHALTGPFFAVNRFFGKNNPDPVCMVARIQDHFIGYNVLVIKAREGETVENFRSVYGSQLYRAVIADIRQGGFDITQSGLSSLEHLDLTRSWTDTELYAHFGLTPDEIAYVESKTAISNAG